MVIKDIPVLFLIELLTVGKALIPMNSKMIPITKIILTGSLFVEIPPRVGIVLRTNGTKN